MKIIASDYDGTLNEGGVDEIKRQAIKKWQAEGNLFGIVSGRGISNIRALAEEDGLECDFLVGDNGAAVAKGNGDIISEVLCEGEVAREIIKYFFTKGCTWSWVRPYPECIVLPEGEPKHPWEQSLSTMPKIEKFSQISAAFESPEKAEISAIELRKLYGETLNILQNVPNKTARWYYLSALANDGLGNQVMALEHIRRAVSMEPENPDYLRTLDEIQNGGAAYRRQAGSFRGFTGRGGGILSWCICLLAQLFCCRRVFCC
jgi:hypothetical protein